MWATSQFSVELAALIWRDDTISCSRVFLDPTSWRNVKVGLLVQHDAQERSVDLQAAVVLDEPELAEFVHEKIHA